MTSACSDDKKIKRTSSPAPTALSTPALSPVVNPLEDGPRETFLNGRPLEDNLNLFQCKLCKKGVVKSAAKAHVDNCMKIKKEKAQRKKEAREARERAKEQAREEEARKADEDGGADAKMNDDSDDDNDDGSPEKKANGGGGGGGGGGKAAKKVGGKKPDGEFKGKKRKADADADKGGPKNKKKKEEPKPKVPKPKGMFLFIPLSCSFIQVLGYLSSVHSVFSIRTFPHTCTHTQIRTPHHTYKQARALTLTHSLTFYIFLLPYMLLYLVHLDTINLIHH